MCRISNKIWGKRLLYAKVDIPFLHDVSIGGRRQVDGENYFNYVSRKP